MQDTNGVNPYAAPGARIEQTQYGSAGDYVLAGRGTRLIAKIIDGALFGLVWLIAFGGAAFADQAGSASPGVALFLAVAAFIGLAILNLIQMNTTGQTLAKKWFGIRVVRSDGSRLEMGRWLGLRAIVPTLISWIPLVGPLFALADALFIFADDRRTLHDRIADTVVIDA